MEAEWWCCDCLLLHIVSGRLPLWLCHCHFFSDVWLGVRLLWGGNGSDPEQMVSYCGWRRDVHCVHVSWVLVHLCCVLVQVIIWRATVRAIYFPFGELSSGSDGFFARRYGELFLVKRTRSCSIKGRITTWRPSAARLFLPEHRQPNVCGCALLEALWLNMPHTAVQRLNLAWTSSCHQQGLTKHKVVKLNRAWTDLRICFVHCSVTIAGHEQCVLTLVLCSGRHILLIKSFSSDLMSVLAGSIEQDLHVNCRASANNYWHYWSICWFIWIYFVRILKWKCPSVFHRVQGDVFKFHVFSNQQCWITNWLKCATAPGPSLPHRPWRLYCLTCGNVIDFN